MATTYGEIYLVRCTLNGKQYIGQTTYKAEYRWRKHREEARGGRGYLLARAIRKYGIETFSMDVIATASNQNELDAIEVSEIIRRNTLTPNGYNLKEGGGRGRHSLESRMKMSASRVGKKASPEARMKMSLVRKGEKRPPRTQEYCEKQRQAHLGKTWPQEQIDRMSAKLRGQKKSPEHTAKSVATRTGAKRSAEQKMRMREGWARRHALFPSLSEAQKAGLEKTHATVRMRAAAKKAARAGLIAPSEIIE